jgi:hypothetical protein
MFFFTSGIFFGPTLTCLCLGEQIMPNNTKTMHVPKIGFDNVPNKVHWGAFNGPLTKSALNCPWFMEGFYIQIICV